MDARARLINRYNNRQLDSAAPMSKRTHSPTRAEATGMQLNRKFLNRMIKQTESHNRRLEVKKCRSTSARERIRTENTTYRHDADVSAEREYWTQRKREKKTKKRSRVGSYEQDEKSSEEDEAKAERQAGAARKSSASSSPVASIKKRKRHKKDKKKKKRNKNRRKRKRKRLV